VIWLSISRDLFWCEVPRRALNFTRRYNWADYFEVAVEFYLLIRLDFTLCESPVTDNDLTVLTTLDIIWLEVEMDYALLVSVRKGITDFEKGSELFIQRVMWLF